MATRIFSELLEDKKQSDRRIENLETSEASFIRTIHNSSLLLNNQLLTDGVEYTTASIISTFNLPQSTKGVFGVMWITPLFADVNIYIDSSSETPNQYSMQYRWRTAANDAREHMSQFIMVPLGIDGKIKLKAVGSNVNVYLSITGYWL